ncbi:MAG: 16S rRNA (guanine(966)-N(2))-methyltransferase RsmD [Candidatus Nomurabacteria bacterium]|jgi:16S rRNA (guanine966-N2)-methyltransferase|nr:16S rRNA (guanine(966)-N(2))-methyltransferase RsmD [Candidatus Nomurabacteria bacterium]
MSKLRIISGEFGGRWIAAPDGRTTHPMGDRVRSGLFNIIDVSGALVLDAYAGSGAVGLEALSRGATTVDFVERDKKAQRIIAENIAGLGVEARAKLYKMSVHGFIDDRVAKMTAANGTRIAYDVVFADPPYHFFDKPDYFSTAFELKKLVKPKGLMVLSYPGRLCAPTVNGVVVVDKRSYGDAGLAVFRFE